MRHVNKKRERDVMEIINKCDINDRRVGEKRGDWRKGKKNKMTLLFHETCRINADLGLVPVMSAFPALGPWAGRLHRYIGGDMNWDRSSGGVRACQITIIYS